jgi:short-subunit dehydrogenase
MQSHEAEMFLRVSEKQFGDITAFIYCATSSDPVMIQSSDLSKFKNQMDINFFCALKFLIPVSKRMI